MKLFTPFALALMLAASWGSASAADIKIRLGSIHIVVADFDRSAAFYKQLGMHVGVTYTPEERQLAWSDPSQGPELVMVRPKDPTRAGLPPGGAALSFEVSDIQALVERLRNAGYAVGEPKDVGPYIVLVTKDPDGNTIEFGQPTGKPTSW